MASKVFLDANILLDFTLKRDGYNEAKKIIEFAVKGQIQAYITPAIVHIVGYWLTKAYGNAKAKELLLTLLADVQVIDSDHEITLNALHSKIKDIEDALQYYTAMHHKIDYFITLDKGFKKEAIPALPICMPTEFLTEFVP
jgi:predicted nucleic acid-binding protein